MQNLKSKKETVAKRKQRLRKKYPFIVAWLQHIGGSKNYITQELNHAEQTNAPPTAIFCNRDGTWSRAEEIANTQFRETIYVSAMLVKGELIEIPKKVS